MYLHTDALKVGTVPRLVVYIFVYVYATMQNIQRDRYVIYIPYSIYVKTIAVHFQYNFNFNEMRSFFQLKNKSMPFTGR